MVKIYFIHADNCPSCQKALLTIEDAIIKCKDISCEIIKLLYNNPIAINITVKNGIFEGTIDLYVHHTKDLNNLILKISNVNGIENIKRVEDFIN